LPITTDKNRNYLRNIFETTQNISFVHPLWTWVSGGLNYHVEHHLFPQMPSRNYARISPAIRQLAEKHSLPFYESAPQEVVVRVWNRLRTRIDQPVVVGGKL